jgi:hypothetical protein
LKHGLRRTAPYVPASEVLINKQVTVLKKLQKAGDPSFSLVRKMGAGPVRCVDLGSGDGSVIFGVQKAFPKWQFFG